MTLAQLSLLPPHELHKLTSQELDTILRPYYAKTRQPLLPPEKSVKKGLDNRLIAEWIKANSGKLNI